MTTFRPDTHIARCEQDDSARARLRRLALAREAEHGDRAFSGVGLSVDVCILVDLLDAFDAKTLDRIADERSKIAELKLEMNQLRTNLHLARDAMKLFGIAECEACQGRGVLQVGQTRGAALCPPVNGCGGTGWKLTPPEDTEPEQLPEFWNRVLGRTHRQGQHGPRPQGLPIDALIEQARVRGTLVTKGELEELIRKSIVGDGSEAQRLRLTPIFALIDAHPIRERLFETDSGKFMALNALLSPGPYLSELRVEDITKLHRDADVIPDTLWDEALRLAEDYELDRGDS